jgi:hypothetical protein
LDKLWLDALSSLVHDVEDEDQNTTGIRFLESKLALATFSSVKCSFVCSFSSGPLKLRRSA